MLRVGFDKHLRVLGALAHVHGDTGIAEPGEPGAVHARLGSVTAERTSAIPASMMACVQGGVLP